MDDWTRIPMEITNETDRRTMAAILVSVGLEVRIVKVKLTKSGTPQKVHRIPPTGVKMMEEKT